MSQATNPTTRDPAEILAALMVSTQPRPEFADALSPFAPLIGSWNLDVSYFAEDGTSRQTKGEWHFSWALDGRAVADIWINPGRAERASQGDGEWGLTVRFYDPELGAFRSTWLGPKHAVVMTFIGRTGDGTIVLEAQQPGSARSRWIFTEITGTGFHWRNEDEDEAGRITVRQRFVATRQDSAGQP